MLSRTVSVKKADGTTEKKVLVLGVTGALYNSNVLFYDREQKGLWSQLSMRAVSGPLVGTELRHLPSRILPFGLFRGLYPGARVLSRDTGHNRTYQRSPYDAYFARKKLMVPMKEHGDALPIMTAGIGILDGAKAWFVVADSIGDGKTIETPRGAVVLTASKNAKGMWSISADRVPEGVQTAQTFYYSWSAFHPSTEVVGKEALESEKDAEGSKDGAGR